jgi:glyoxylase-like metal-dependent hydrolase (beta-lactamase superfamily II)
MMESAQKNFINSSCLEAECRVTAPFGLAIVVLGLFLGISRASADIIQVSPEIKTFDLDAFKISALRDGALAFSNDATIFGLNANLAVVGKVLHQAGAPTDKIRLDIDVLLIRMPHHLVLLDAGYGVAGHSVLRQSLALIGVSSAQITDILITHAHPDHVGGLVDAQGRLAFPNATIRMSAKEWSFMQTEEGLSNEIPVIKVQVLTFETGQPVLPGITPVALPGHTPGQVGYEIVSKGQRLIDIGDVAHSAIISLSKPDWTLAWDADKEEAVRTRRKELLHLAITHEELFAPHFPFPGVGQIQKSGNGFKFKPELPTDFEL